MRTPSRSVTVKDSRPFTMPSTSTAQPCACRLSILSLLAQKFSAQLVMVSCTYTDLIEGMWWQLSLTLAASVCRHLGMGNACELILGRHQACQGILPSQHPHAMAMGKQKGFCHPLKYSTQWCC